MNKRIDASGLFGIVLFLLFSLSGCGEGGEKSGEEGYENNEESHLLLFSKTVGYRHQSIDVAVPALNALSQDGIKKSKKTIFPGEEWEIATPESQGVNSFKLKETIQFLEENSGFDGVKEVMIVRNGYLIWEGEAVDKVHGVWSVTKSFTSTVLGLSLIHISEPTRRTPISYAVFC